MLHFATLDDDYSQDGFRAIKLKFKNDIAKMRESSCQF